MQSLPDDEHCEHHGQSYGATTESTPLVSHERSSFSVALRDDPWEVLLAELLRQRTRADLVAPVYEEALTNGRTARRCTSG